MLVALIVLGLYNGLVFFPVLLLILGPPASLSPADDGTSLPPPTPQPSPPRFKTKHGPNRAPAAPTPKKISSGKPKRHNSDLSLSTIAEETHSHSQSYCNNNSNSSWDSNSQESEPNLPSSTHSSLNGGTSVFLEPHITVETSTVPQSVIIKLYTHKLCYTHFTARTCHMSSLQISNIKGHCIWP